MIMPQGVTGPKTWDLLTPETGTYQTLKMKVALKSRRTQSPATSLRKPQNSHFKHFIC